MGLTESLISKVSQLTALVTQIVNQALKTEDLPNATTPLSGTELVRVVESGVSKQIAVSDLPTSVSSVEAYPYQTPTIWKASGNIGAGLEAGDLLSRWWSTTEFWSLARYDGGSTTVKTSYTILNSI